MTVSRRRTFLISVAAELAGMHAQTLRTYDRLGLVSPRRSSGGGRRYSQRDVDLLREVQRLSQDEGVNLAGIKRIIELTNQVEALQSRLSEMAQELEQLRVNQRRDVAVVPKSTALVVWQPRAKRLGHLDREAHGLRLARGGEAVVAAAQCVRGSRHRLDADDIVVAGREQLRCGITLFERDVDATVAALEREHRAVGHLVEPVVVRDGLEWFGPAGPVLVISRSAGPSCRRGGVACSAW